MCIKPYAVDMVEERLQSVVDCSGDAVAVDELTADIT